MEKSAFLYVEELAEQVDAVWLGDASGYGEDHFDLIAPALKRGLPTFCDKPIGGSVVGTKKILEFAKKNNAPIMSSSLFRHEQGMEAALRKRDSGESLRDMGRDALLEDLKTQVQEAYERKEKELGPELMRFLEKTFMLQVIDHHWKDHLLAMDHLRDGIGLRGYGQKDPLIEYKR